jgi:hypothetical protein
MRTDEFILAYHQAIQEKLSDEISLLMQNWHRELSIEFAERFGVSQKAAFEAMEHEYLHRGYVTLDFLSDENELWS